MLGFACQSVLHLLLTLGYCQALGVQNTGQYKNGSQDTYLRRFPEPLSRTATLRQRWPRSQVQRGIRLAYTVV